MPLYAFRLSLSHPTFRIPHLLSIAQLFGFPIKFVSEDLYRSVLVIELQSREDAEQILGRGIVVMSAIELLGSASSYDELHMDLQSRPEAIEQDMHKPFKFSLESFNHHVPMDRQLATINRFRWMALKGGVNLKKPEVEYIIYEDYDPIETGSHEPGTRNNRDGKFHRVYFGRLIGLGRARSLVAAQNVKTRAYYGNTSMEAEMGLFVAGQALPAPGRIIYDPFVGTGSLLYSCAHWGAYVVGSDIDGRQMRGKAKGKGVVPGILRAAAQYGVADRFLDNFTFDISKSPWRRGGWMDAIVTDPPYGVRAGAKRLGKRAGRKPPREEAFVMPDGTKSHERGDYLPPYKPYPLPHLLLDLIRFARYMLVPRGRLVFFLPTVTEEWDQVDLPIVEGMRELRWEEGSVQEFGKWGRRLITMEKTAVDDGPVPSFDDYEAYEQQLVKEPGHQDFAKKYFVRNKEDAVAAVDDPGADVADHLKVA